MWRQLTLYHAILAALCLVHSSDRRIGVLTVFSLQQCLRPLWATPIVAIRLRSRMMGNRCIIASLAFEPRILLECRLLLRDRFDLKAIVVLIDSGGMSSLFRFLSLDIPSSGI